MKNVPIEDFSRGCCAIAHGWDVMRTLTTIIIAACFSTAIAAQAGPIKIATVDMQELFRQYHRTNEAQQQINIERAKIQKDNNERLARIRELEATLGSLRKQIDSTLI